MAGPMLGMMRAARRRDVRRARSARARRARRRGRRLAPTSGCRSAPPARAVLLPAEHRAFGEGLGVPADEVRLYLALRECAHQRLFAHVPWLRGAAARRRRGLRARHRRRHRRGSRRSCASVDPANPEAVQEALQSGMFEPEDTPEQKAALARLETLLALVEGWVDAVVTEARDARCPAPPRAARDGPPAPRDRRSGRADVRHAGRSRAAPAPAARGRRAVGELRGPAASRAATRSGRTPTCCPTADDLDDPAAFVASARGARPVRARRTSATARRPSRRRGARRRRRARPPVTHCATPHATRGAGPPGSRPTPEQDALRDDVPRLPRRARRRHAGATCRAGHLTASALVLDATRRPGAADAAPQGRPVAAARRPLRAGRRDPGRGRAARGDRGVRHRRAEHARAAPVRLDRHPVRCGVGGASARHLDVQYVAIAPAGSRARVSDGVAGPALVAGRRAAAGTDASVRALVGSAVSLAR